MSEVPSLLPADEWLPFELEGRLYLHLYATTAMCVGDS